MRIPRSLGVVLAASLAAGCTLTDAMFSPPPPRDNADLSLPIPYADRAGQPMRLSPPPAAAPAAPAAAAPAPAAAPSPPPQSYVSQKIADLRTDSRRLKASLDQHQKDEVEVRRALEGDAGVYFNMVAAINARLQVGTTAGDPELLTRWNQAQAALDKMGNEAKRFAKVQEGAANDAAFSGYLGETIRASHLLPGATDEDRRNIAQIDGELRSTAPLIEAFQKSLADDVARQSASAANEHANLASLAAAIKTGQLYGPSLAARAPSVAPPVVQPVRSAALAPAAPPARAQRALALPPDEPPPLPAPVAAALPAAQRPLVTIRFDQPNVAYEQALYTAVSRALERRPDAHFDLVAVAPGAGDASEVQRKASASRQHAEAVMRSLSSMGLPSDRMSLSATTRSDTPGSEVLLYVR